ncbi:MAG: serine/threonine protein kinase [Planctomycetia bacterium]|nr:serine/threonine protein kinase [Planctomycetia bacterium]
MGDTTASKALLPRHINPGDDSSNDGTKALAADLRLSADLGFDGAGQFGEVQSTDGVSPVVGISNPLSGSSKLAAVVAGQGDGSKGAGAAQSNTATPAEVSPDDRTVISRQTPELSNQSANQTSMELGRLLVGQRLGHFELEEFVGGGGMGAVFRGTDTMLGRTVAIKVLARQHADDEETTRRFRNEAQSAARLDHENIARVYYVGIDRGWHYIVLEYIAGQNLRDLVMERGPLPVADVLGFTTQVADALAHASSRDVVHRDIKPSNVLVTADNRVKLVDMGLARLRQVEHSSDDLTASGVTLGTFDYISPEQARDPRAADVRSDLYSLGCTMYYMLCGRPPFPEGTVLQKLLQHQGDEAPDIRQFRSDVPEPLIAAVRKLLAKNPQQRFQHPAELNAELLLLCDQLGLSAPAGRPTAWLAPPTPAASWTERHLPWLVPVCLLILAVVGMQFYGSGGSDIGPRPVRTPIAATKGASDINGPAAIIAAADRSPSAAGQTARSNSTGRPGSSSKIRSEKNGAADRDRTSPRVLVDRSGDNATIGASGLPESAVSATGGPRRDFTRHPPAITMPETDHDSATTGAPMTDRRPTAMPSDTDDKGPASASTPPYVVVSNGSERSFNSLSDACRQTTSGSVIELRFNGERDERPIVLSNRELTLRAGEGFHPVVRFRPEVSDPVIYPHSMLTVAGGDLRVFNVELLLQIPQTVRSDGWTLIEAIEADKVRLERCTLTIANAQDDGATYRQGVSFFAVHAGPHHDSSTTMMMSEPNMSDSRVNLELRDCIVRGEANLLTGESLQSVSLQWENGLLATSERLVSVVGGREAIPMSRQLQIDLQHVTALMRRGMCLLSQGEDERFLPTVRLGCTDCILMTDGSPLIDERGDETINELKKRLLWRGNGNLYAGVDVFWRIESSQTTSPMQHDWFAWQEQWGRGREIAQRGGMEVFQRFPERRRMISTHAPGDYALDEKSPDNIARGTATDGNSDIGLKAELLPTANDAAAAPTRMRDTPRVVPPESPASPKVEQPAEAEPE